MHVLRIIIINVCYPQNGQPTMEDKCCEEHNGLVIDQPSERPRLSEQPIKQPRHHPRENKGRDADILCWYDEEQSQSDH